MSPRKKAKMKSKAQIIKDSIKFETPPKDYNLIEIYCFLALKQLLIMFHNKQITTENASKTKKIIFAEYDEQCEGIKDTEMKRAKLRKMLNGEVEEAQPITEARLCEALNLAIEILTTVFKGEFY